MAEAPHDGDVRHVAAVQGHLASVDWGLSRLISRGQPLHIVDEAGASGFLIWRHFIRLDLRCEVAAPSSIPAHPVRASHDRWARRGGICIGEFTP